MTGLRLGAALALVTAAARRDCRCEDLALARRAPVPRRVVLPAAFASRNLSSQVALLKVPETGSSTAANVFAELAAKFKRPAWVSMRPGEFERVVAAPARTAPKWALGHRGWGPWLRDHFDERVVDLATTARAPAARLASSAEKRLLRGEPADCERSAGVALKFWGVDAQKGPAAGARHFLKVFDDVVVTERYNESLVALALRRRLQLGDVLPPLAKYHGGGGRAGAAARTPTRAEAVRRCAATARGGSAELAVERAIHAAASARLDATLGELRERGVDVDALLAAFAEHLHAAMTSGARHVAKALGRPTSPAAGADTLIMSLCFRRCAIAALDRAVVLEYPGPEAPRAGRARGWLRRGAD